MCPMMRAGSIVFHSWDKTQKNCSITLQFSFFVPPQLKKLFTQYRKARERGTTIIQDLWLLPGGLLPWRVIRPYSRSVHEKLIFVIFKLLRFWGFCSLQHNLI